jgi:hypothetical protein
MGPVEYSDHIWKTSDWETQVCSLLEIPELPEYAPKKDPLPSEIRQSLHGMVSDKLSSLLNGWMNGLQRAVDPGSSLHNKYLNDSVLEQNIDG